MRSPRLPRGQIFPASAGCDRGIQACAHARSRGRLLLFAVQRLAGGTLPFSSNALSAGNVVRKDTGGKKEPVVNLPVAAHPPSNGFIGVRPIMAVIAI